MLFVVLKGYVMQIIHKKIHETEYKPILELPSFFDNSCYIDIETTGFDRKRHMIYLVGLIYKLDGIFYLEQYLCDKSSDEYELLYRLNEKLSQYDYLVHFNGQSFDLPFIHARLKLYNIPTQMDACKSIDYYHALKPYKHLLKTDNLKLKTLERLLGFQRSDPFDGGQLIELFNSYVQGDVQLRPALLLHNEQDMIGLYLLNAFYPLYVLTYTKELPTKCATINTDKIILTKSLPDSHGYYLFEHFSPYGKVNVNMDRIECSLMLYEGVLKYFYSDYTQYYYLPVEDYAIHKSVANYVNQQYKKKATKATAYVKKKDIYVRCPLSEKEIIQLQTTENPITVFHMDYDETHTYIQIDTFKKIYPHVFTPLLKALLS